jgi:hypothetical protein
MTPEPPAALPGNNPDLLALASHHRTNLADLARMPYDPEYVTPPEILRILRYCFVYGVDFTQGLEPRKRDATRTFDVPVTREGEGVAYESRACRVRRETLLENPEGSWIPDGDVVWANRLLGILIRCATTQLEASIGRRQ